MKAFIVAAAWLLAAPLGLTLAELPPVVKRMVAPRIQIVDGVEHFHTRTVSLASHTNHHAHPHFTIRRFSNHRAASYHVNSSALPLIKTKLQDSWAGQTPISSNQNETRKLFFFYWPSSKKGGSNDPTIWLDGGPGCSSMEGFLEENGPISYEPGSKGIKTGPYAWTTASDMV